MHSKRILSLVLSFVLAFSCVAFADDTKADITDQYESSAETLYIYGLFKGGAAGFDLDSESTVAQAAVMVVRLLGAEDEVLNNSFSHPYTDVPKWASDYVGYLYQNNIDIAKSETLLGADENISAADFVVLILRALEYYDISVESTKEQVCSKAVKTGLLTEEEIAEIKDTEFNRGTMVYVANKALNTKIAGSDETLYDVLNEENVLKLYDAPSDEIKYGPVNTEPATVEKADTSIGDTIVAKAKNNVGVRYRSGGKSPSTGFDCSGFVGYSMIQSGVWSQFYGSCDGVMSKCTKVSKTEAQPGDVVFFTNTYSSSHTYTHVGIYIGNNQMVHASSSSGVTVSSISSGYWASHYSCIARPTVLM